MSKEQIVSDAISQIAAGQAQVLQDAVSAVYDKAQAEVPQGSGGGFSQADMDAAVQKAKDDQKASDDADLAAQKAADDQAMADALAKAKADADAAAADLQAKIDDVSGKLQVDEGLIQGLKDSADKLQAMVDAIHALFPAPPPVDQPPVDQPPQQ